MLAVVGILLNGLMWMVGEIAARWGLKTALIALIVSCYAATFAFVATVLSMFSGLSSMPAPSFLFQFFPDASTIAQCATIYWGTLGWLRAYAWCKDILVNTAKIAAS